MKNEKEINKQIETVESTNYRGIVRALKLSEEENKSAKAMRIYEKVMFDKFKNIIKDETYFRIEHFKKLEIDYDILIHLSAKNAGKTTELYRCISDCIKRKEKFIYGRVTVSEMESEIEKFAVEKNSPVVILTNKNRFYFFTKKAIEQYIEENTTETKEANVTFAALVKAGYDWVGLGMTFMNSNTLGAGSYENFSTIFFDEIVSYQPREYVNDKVLYNWGCAVSTVLRNKKQLTIVMMGNLRNGIDKVPILDYYGIDIADDLRIVKRSMENSDRSCTILYVNSGSLYKSTLKNQAAVAHHAKIDDRLFMEHNKIINTSTKILTQEIFEKMKNVFAFAVNWDAMDFVLNLRQTGEKPNKYALGVRDLTLTTNVGCPIYSDSIVLLNQYSALEHGDIETFINYIYMLCANKVLYYDTIRSLKIGTMCIEELYDQYFDDET